MNINKVHPIISENIEVSKFILSLSCIFSIIYIMWWFNLNNVGNPFLYFALLVGEVFHIFQAIGYAFTIWDQKPLKHKKITTFYPVDIFVTVCGEPAEIVEKTLKGIAALDYPNYSVYVLNDGKAAGKENWKEIDALALKYKATPITRETNEGAKAGNINNALKHSISPYVLIFDADHVPAENFLQETMGHFSDEKLALVQTPQYYENNDDSFLTKAAWEQQELFFGPICRGKNKDNATFWCGTNAIVKREALLSIGGVPMDNIAEDFLATLFMHQKGWKTLYVAKILAKGLAPHTLADYVNQQFRWARGSLEIIFKYNPLFKAGLTWRQKFQYLYSSSYYLNGLIVLVNALIPLMVLAFNVSPVSSETSEFIIFFLPFIFLTLYLLMSSTKHQITFAAIQLSVSCFFVFFMAMVSTALNMKVSFKVTSKDQKEGNFLVFAMPHFIYIGLSVLVVGYAIMTQGVTPSVMTNTSWILFNIIFFNAFIVAAYPWRNLKANTLSYLYNLKYRVLNSFKFLPNVGPLEYEERK